MSVLTRLCFSCWRKTKRTERLNFFPFLEVYEKNLNMRTFRLGFFLVQWFSNGGDFSRLPPGDISSVWGHSGCRRGEGVSLAFGRGQGCRSVSFNAGDSATQRQSPSLSVRSAAVEKACVIRHVERGCQPSDFWGCRVHVCTERHSPLREAVGRGGQRGPQGPWKTWVCIVACH